MKDEKLEAIEEQLKEEETLPEEETIEEEVETQEEELESVDMAEEEGTEEEVEEEEAPKSKKVPLKAVQAERRKRQFYQKQVEELKRSQEELIARLNQLGQYQQMPQPGAPQVPAQPGMPQQEDPLKQLLQPVVQPEIQKIRDELLAAVYDNQDRMNFLLNHPDLDPDTFKKVEELRIQLFQSRGIALPREDVYYYMLGMTQKERKQLVNEETQKAKAKQKAMNKSAKVSTSTVTAPAPKGLNPETMTKDQLREALKNFKF